MPRGLLFRRIIAGILILIFVATTIYSIATNFDDPMLIFAGMLLGIAGLIEPVSIIWDRFIPDATTRRRTPAADARDVDLIISALQASNPDVRQGAVNALGRIADPRAVDPLIKTLRDSHSGVRGWVAKIGTPEALAAVEQWERKQQSGG